ncbi:MAG: 4a-hydroxytetrahydrobiopterin dehydratase [Rubrivivax sp.]|nr:4a-hydroxytetrahydrobiopterin dehydratase [Rubrivivax sp.]MDP3224942.1 4a-hydroxytetrahydrobiopterin dehydratase [Rubrivivax sp.]MDP3615885.1 4a-hydroxytetrahydrobiopterin dehydratase [Rubrivivax sp.]
MTSLAARHCQPLEGQPAMDDAQVQQHLAQAPGWSLVEGAIQKRFDFADYHRTMAFVNAQAWVAHVEDHHPDLLVSYNRCTVRFNTHSVGGISINDFICAAKLDALVHSAAP